MVKHRPAHHTYIGQVACLIALPALGACAAIPTSTAFSFPPGIAPQASSYAIAPPADDASRAAMPFVDAQLKRLGYRPSDVPDLIVMVSATGRGRNVGAMAAEACFPTKWIEAPDKKWLIGGGKTLGLQVHMIDAKSQKTLYRSSAELRTNSVSAGAHASLLVAAMLSTDPRHAPVCATP